MLGDTAVTLILHTIKGIHDGDIAPPELIDEVASNLSDEACFIVQCHELLNGIETILKN